MCYPRLFPLLLLLTRHNAISIWLIFRCSLRLFFFSHFFIFQDLPSTSQSSLRVRCFFASLSLFDRARIWVKTKNLHFLLLSFHSFLYCFWWTRWTSSYRRRNLQFYRISGSYLKLSWNFGWKAFFPPELSCRSWWLQNFYGQPLCCSTWLWKVP